MIKLLTNTYCKVVGLVIVLVIISFVTLVGCKSHKSNNDNIHNSSLSDVQNSKDNTIESNDNTDIKSNNQNSSSLQAQINNSVTVETPNGWTADSNSDNEDVNDPSSGGSSLYAESDELTSSKQLHGALNYDSKNYTDIIN